MLSMLTSTKYQKSIKAPQPDRHVLMPGTNNKKLGSRVKKGLMWGGKYMYALTLTERETCPKSCHHWNDCYGNNMPFAKRWKTGKALQVAIENDIKRLTRKHRDGIVVRLHVLGDFYHVGYVKFWAKMLRKYPTLSIFGYTARSTGSIYQQIMFTNQEFPDQCVIRVSKNRNYQYAPTNPGFKLRYASTEDFYGEFFGCPEQTGVLPSCASCGLCWASTRTVKFYSH